MSIERRSMPQMLCHFLPHHKGSWEISRRQQKAGSRMDKKIWIYFGISTELYPAFSAGTVPLQVGPLWLAAPTANQHKRPTLPETLHDGVSAEETCQSYDRRPWTENCIASASMRLCKYGVHVPETAASRPSSFGSLLGPVSQPMLVVAVSALFDETSCPAIAEARDGSPRVSHRLPKTRMCGAGSSDQVSTTWPHHDLTLYSKVRGHAAVHTIRLPSGVLVLCALCWVISR
ncbi:uncharacterized protein RCC_07967 [Ramularia collo-cygni]|uniref:Uncharacterized protein n=1 Tax=Ramularia collo-cygni TaxID=112498 RepID=A0A2D3V2P9_9PEZI|nr:uncharacterized protein RCC_07967 [Ramularia collo-cygni]CZT22098.1 uncharacterized protein RCC_07967 [Ramularia collo-cygni]